MSLALQERPSNKLATLVRRLQRARKGLPRKVSVPGGQGLQGQGRGDLEGRGRWMPPNQDRWDRRLQLHLLLPQSLPVSFPGDQEEVV